MPTITEYLIATCSLIIDEFNETYQGYTVEQMKPIADKKYNEMDLVVRIGYPFRNLVHYTTNANDEGGNLSKLNHDLVISHKEYAIEVKYLKNWDSSKGNTTGSKLWSEFQKDFDWLFKEIDKNKKNKRAFIIGWFNCVDCVSRYIQLGQGRGSKPIVNEERLAYFPFLTKKCANARATDLQYDYGSAYVEQRVNLIGRSGTNYNSLFIGNKEDKFHFAIYY